MATSAFKSTSRRTPIGKSSGSPDDSSSSIPSSAYRRSRSLSRFSRRMPASADEGFDGGPAPSGRFVNTVRGSGFPEISLDDLAIQFFDSSGGRGRSASRNNDAGGNDKLSVSQRRGRSVSRQSSRVGGGEGKGSIGNCSGGGRVVSDGNSRRRRSVSVVRYQISDSESDVDHSQNSNNRDDRKNITSRNNQMPFVDKPTVSNPRQGLRRSLSQKGLKYHDGYSSQSSVLTDDEGRDAHSNKNGIERTIRAVYAQKKAEHPIGDDVNGGLYEAMRKELRNAVEEIRLGLEQSTTNSKSSGSASDDSLQSKTSDVLQAVSTVRRDYATKLEQSEKRKQDLLAEIVLEERRGRELSKIVKELLPDPKNGVVEKPSRTRKRSNDRNRMSRRLTEEAEKYIEDFISNVEDTDISSIDGERSDTSSTLGGLTKMENFQTPVMSKVLPVEMDGIVLPWLQWETSNDASSLIGKNRVEQTVTPTNKLHGVVQEGTPVKDLSAYSASSRGSWSPGIVEGRFGEDTGGKFGETTSYQNQFVLDGTRRPQVDVDKYLKLQSDEEFLFERWRQQQRIHSGGILLCNQMFF